MRRRVNERTLQTGSSASLVSFDDLIKANTPERNSIAKLNLHLALQPPFSFLTLNSPLLHRVPRPLPLLFSLSAHTCRAAGSEVSVRRSPRGCATLSTCVKSKADLPSVCSAFKGLIQEIRTGDEQSSGQIEGRQTERERESLFLGGFCITERGTKNTCTTQSTHIMI